MNVANRKNKPYGASVTANEVLLMNLRRRVKESDYFWRKPTRHGFKIQFTEFPNGFGLVIHGRYFRPGCLAGT